MTATHPRATPRGDERMTDYLTKQLAEQPIDLVLRRITALDWVTLHLESLWVAEDEGDRRAREVFTAQEWVLGSAFPVYLERLERAIQRWQQAHS